MNRRPRGFTLLELLIALLVFVTAIAGILAIYGVATAAHRRGVQQTQARLIARRLLAEVQARDLGPTRPVDTTDAAYPDYGGLYRYDITYRPVSVMGDNVAAAYLVRIVVHPAGTTPADEKYRTDAETYEAVLLRRSQP
jgi:Tfp pilus assembly protein PilV